MSNKLLTHTHSCFPPLYQLSFLHFLFSCTHCYMSLSSKVTPWHTTAAGRSPPETETAPTSGSVPCPTGEDGGTGTATRPTSTACSPHLKITRSKVTTGHSVTNTHTETHWNTHTHTHWETLFPGECDKPQKTSGKRSTAEAGRELEADQLCAEARISSQLWPPQTPPVHSLPSPHTRSVSPCLSMPYGRGWMRCRL